MLAALYLLSQMQPIEMKLIFEIFRLAFDFHLYRLYCRAIGPSVLDIFAARRRINETRLVKCIN